MGAGIAVTGSKAVDRVPGIVNRVTVTTARARGAEAYRGVGVATTRAGGIGPVWVLATRRRTEADVTTAATTAADAAGSVVDAGLVTEAWVALGVREGVVKPSSKASGAASFSAATMDRIPAVVNTARVGRPSRRGWETTGDENTPPGATEASDAAPSAPRPPSSSISTGIEASVPGVMPLETTGVLGSEAVDAVDDAGKCFCPRDR
ncbi:unnamed protein product [Phytophthora fragariaefolia]|uniref:Unnamed protein product n=1 Tax=Phytophthora fragariaefolia TaxID=1490495 RepID=A0A9W6XEP2_9STRA|nr:unnamed protein product [Phytophthora fragariaefolia]